jgi:hypothetical protein
MKRSPKKVAVTVLALGTASAAVVFGSFAAWTASTSNPGNSITSGTLTMSNSKSAAAVFTATAAKPGDSGSDTVTVTNTGSIPMTAKITQASVTDSGFGSDLTLKIHDDTANRCIWPTQAAGACSTYGAWDASATLTNFTLDGTGGSGSQWAASEAHTFTASWSFDSGAGNGTQGKTATFGLTWGGAQ